MGRGAAQISKGSLTRRTNQTTRNGHDGRCTAFPCIKKIHKSANIHTYTGIYIYIDIDVQVQKNRYRENPTLKSIDKPFWDRRPQKATKPTRKCGTLRLLSSFPPADLHQREVGTKSSKCKGTLFLPLGSFHAGVYRELGAASMSS